MINKARLARNNWWEAVKLANTVKGHQYYKMPEMIKYRYPAPGSCALERVDHPNLYKMHWKTPFRDSHYNIRMKEKEFTTAENTEHFISEMPSVDPSKSEHERMLSLQMQPDTSDLQSAYDEDGDDLSAIWAEQEGEAEKMRIMCRDYTHSHWDLDEEYNHVTFLVGGYDRDYSGISNDWKSRQLLCEYEYWIEEVIGAKRIREQRIPMYKGTVKKW